MEKAPLLLLTLEWCMILSEDTYENNVQDLKSSNNDKFVYDYAVPVVPFPSVSTADKSVKNNPFNGYLPPNAALLQQPQIDLHAIIDGNPLLAALLLGASLGLPAKPSASNHPELFPINPYVALLLSQYGRYVPYHGTGRRIYAYAASNNYHNNKPFGSYKVYEDAK